jgi:hypothetical protein
VASPGLADIFHGKITLSGYQLNGDQILPMYRRTGQMHITGLGFDQTAQYQVIVSSTPSILGYDGTNTGEQMDYTPVGAFGADGRFIVDIFNLVPGNNISVQIIRNDTGQSWTVTQDINGNPIAIQEGKLTQVALRLSNNSMLAIFVQIRDWESVIIIRDF